jgi:hypothetical protein
MPQDFNPMPAPSPSASRRNASLKFPLENDDPSIIEPIGLTTSAA